MSRYRDEVRDIEKEAGFTLVRILKWGIPTIVTLALLGWLAQSLGIISMNIQRETVQHSQQYTETKVALLNKLYSDYEQLGAEMAELRSVAGNDEIIAAKQAQQRATLKRLRNEAGLIPNSQVPDHIQSFLSTHQ